MTDLHRYLPHLRPGYHHQNNAICTVVLATDGPTPERKHSSHESWTPEDLRGIPIIGRGVAGTVPGTNPETATIRNLDP